MRLSLPQIKNANTTSPVVLGLRFAQAFTGLVTMSLSAYVANWYNMDTLTTSPVQVNFLIIMPLFSFWTIVYLEVLPRFTTAASHPYASVAMEAINALGYLGGFIALAVFLSQLLFCRGSVCAAAQSATGFGAASFILWGITTFFVSRESAKSGFRKPNSAVAAAMREKEANLA